MTISSPQRAASGWHAAFVDALPDAVITLDAADGRIITANPAALRLFNTRFDVMCGQHFSTLLPAHAADIDTPVERRFRLTGELAETEVFVDADGSDILCDTVAMAVHDENVKVVVLHLRDVRERESHRRGLIEAEREAALAEAAVTFHHTLDQYMSHFAHDMKTPLAVILSSSSMLDRYYSRLSDARREEHFSRIQAQVRYLTELLDNLRFLSQLDSTQIAPRQDQYDVMGLLEEVISSYADHPQQPLFDVQTEGTISHLYMDGLLWRRSISHLISNAVKFGPRGGMVHVIVSRRPDSTLETRVSDHGPGLPPEFETSSFRLFRRRRSDDDTPGGGLGLTIASRCIALLGGSMTYEIAPNMGASFTVTIPVE